LGLLVSQTPARCNVAGHGRVLPPVLACNTGVALSWLRVVSNTDVGVFEKLPERQAYSSRNDVEVEESETDAA